MEFMQIFSKKRIMVIFSVVIIMLLGGCTPEKDVKQPDKLGKLVKTLVVDSANTSQSYNYPGKVVASQQVDLSFQVSGKIISLPIKNGAQITKGQVLAILDPSDFENNLKDSQAALTLAQSQFKRAESLIKDNNISRADYDKAKSQLDKAESQVGLAQKALADTKLTAPFQGIVANSYVELFEEVQSNQKILSLQNVDQIDVVVYIPEQDMIKAQRDPNKRPDYKKQIEFDALPGELYDVTLKEYTTESDSSTNTFEVTLTLPAIEGRNILPGMSLIFYLEKNESTEPKIILIPAVAVYTDEAGMQYVWVVDEEQKVVNKRIVKLGNLSESYAEIKEGLKAKERIVTSGGAQLVEGMAVRLWQQSGE